jgi:uncharacterized damage-inducible protein DinB
VGPDVDLRDSMLAAWRTNARVTARLIARLPAPVYAAEMPGAPRRTVRMIAAHLHNSRCAWIRTLGKPHGLAVPPPVDRRTVARRDLLGALRVSGRGILDLLSLGCARGGRLPPTRAYVWRNLALDVGHVLTYFVAHEAHHRGQLVLVARELGRPLPSSDRNDLWQWRP